MSRCRVAAHDITFHDSLFHQHLLIDDTSMNNANIVVNYNMFPADTADCVGGPEGRIWPHDTSHSSTPDGVLIESNNIGGSHLAVRRHPGRRLRRADHR